MPPLNPALERWEPAYIKATTDSPDEKDTTVINSSHGKLTQ